MPDRIASYLKKKPAAFINDISNDISSCVLVVISHAQWMNENRNTSTRHNKILVHYRPSANRPPSLTN